GAEPDEILAMLSTDDARDPILARSELHRSLVATRCEDDAIIFEAERASVERSSNLGARKIARHPMHRRARPGVGLVRMTARARLRACVVSVQHVAGFCLMLHCVGR